MCSPEVLEQLRRRPCRAPAVVARPDPATPVEETLEAAGLDEAELDVHVRRRHRARPRRCRRSAGASPSAEVDGILGAVVIAKALHFGLGAQVVLMTEDRAELPVKAAVQGAGMNVRRTDESDPGNATTFMPTPIGREDGVAHAGEVFEKLTPSAVPIGSEKLAPNHVSMIHGATGLSYDDVPTKSDVYFDATGPRHPDPGIGDGGNEVGFGVIREAVADIMPAGRIYLCPCKEAAHRPSPPTSSSWRRSRTGIGRPTPCWRTSHAALAMIGATEVERMLRQRSTPARSMGRRAGHRCPTTCRSNRNGATSRSCANSSRSPSPTSPHQGTDRQPSTAARGHDAAALRSGFFGRHTLLAGDGRTPTSLAGPSRRCLRVVARKDLPSPALRNTMPTERAAWQVTPAESPLLPPSGPRRTTCFQVAKRSDFPRCGCRLNSLLPDATPLADPGSFFVGRRPLSARTWCTQRQPRVARSMPDNEEEPVIIVGGNFEVDPEQRNAFLAERHERMRTSRREWVSRVHVRRRSARAESGHPVERWESQAALDAHLAATAPPMTVTPRSASVTPTKSPESARWADRYGLIVNRSSASREPNHRRGVQGEGCLGIGPRVVEIVAGVDAQFRQPTPVDVE